MVENNNNVFNFGFDISDELVEEVHILDEYNSKKPNIIFCSIALATAFVICFASFYIGTRLYPDKQSVPSVVEAMKLTDKDYVAASATKETLTKEKEYLTEDSLNALKELSDLKTLLNDKETSQKKLNDLNAQYKSLSAELTQKKEQIESAKNNAYTITLNPGVYVVGKNIIAATFDVSSNGSIIAASEAKETKINEKLSKTTPVSLKFFDGYTIKINATTKFVLKE